MDAQHLDYDDESLVRAALQAAYPAERPIFSQRRGAQIIHAAAREALSHPDRYRPFVGSRVAACLAATFTLLAGTAGVAGAALPGQPLYPIKRVVERAMVAIAGDDVEAAHLELRFAQRRLVEAEAVAGGDGDELSTSISDRFDAHLSAATSLAGEDVAEEVEQLEQSKRGAADGTADSATPVTGAAPAVAETEVPALSVDPMPVGSETPSPSASASPMPVQAADPATPSPAPSPSPSAGGLDGAITLPERPSPLSTDPDANTRTRAD